MVTEHLRTVTFEVTGQRSFVRVNDDQFGSQYWVSKWTFETSWRDFNNMAVIYR